MNIANLPDRFFAFVIELIIYCLFIAFCWSDAYFVFGQSLVDSYDAQEFVVVDGQLVDVGASRTFTFGNSGTGFYAWLLYCLYFVWSEVRWGQTLGKRAIGLRVVDARSGDNLSVWQSIIRLAFFHIGTIGLFIPTWIIMAVSERNQRTGDAAAKTLVVYKGQELSYGPA